MEMFSFSLLGSVWRLWSPDVSDTAAERMGWRFFFKYALEHIALSFGLTHKREKIKVVYLRFLRSNVFYRSLTSDLRVLKQVFIDDQFDSLNLPSEAGIIIDAGANCGYSTLYFAWKYPSSNVFALEPDQNNFNILKLNGEIFPNRIHSILGALWPEDKTVYTSDTGFRGGGNWAIQVREDSVGDSTETKGLSPMSLYSKIGTKKIDLFKIDIEGGEVPLLLHQENSWLDHVECLVIELHDDVKIGGVSASQALSVALAGRTYSRSHCHENTIINFGSSVISGG